MKKLLLTSAIFLGMTSQAWANLDLAKKNACMGCHAVEGKVLGPAFKEVATRYSSDKEALSKISATIKKGSVGKWGAVMMPPNEQLTDADTRTLAIWILGLK